MNYELIEMEGPSFHLTEQLIKNSFSLIAFNLMKRLKITNVLISLSNVKIT